MAPKNINIKGLFVEIREVEIEDASFTLDLRTDPQLSKFIFKTENNLTKQEKWIEKQKILKNDYYFIISDHQEKNKIGTISIYDIENNHGEIGRWLSRGNSIQNIDSIILAYDFAFQELNLDYVDSFTNKENINIVNFHKNFGSVFIREVPKFEYKNFPSPIMQYRIEKQNYYEKIRPQQIKLLENFL